MADASNPTATIPANAELQRLPWTVISRSGMGRTMTEVVAQKKCPRPTFGTYADQRGQIGPLSLEELKIRLAAPPRRGGHAHMGQPFAGLEKGQGRT